nr:immunoglobulin heavy chain junction region [Mus musculus]NSM04828.1 immunoglobulin heavy chain junction region [Mus musculus]NSM04990.1 immunoglobulin heavy chain junction region [Mus musculus]NSM05599.1 immunoglobulin heavy chain junction region [Mus musculus]NSM05764.1 immunoglobulin heavy chain junction region [Mus musculus]
CARRDSSYLRGYFDYW